MDPSTEKKQLPSGRVPQGIRIYAIGDIHGCLDLLERTFARIDAHRRNNPIERSIEIFLGDYVDRGPASRGVIDRLIERAVDHEAVFLKGNHEVILSAFLEDPLVLDDWKKFGAMETLLSYGLKPPAKIKTDDRTSLSKELAAALPASHRQFLNGLKLSFACGDYFFVHAGVRPGVTLDQQEEADLLWIRQDFLDHRDPFDKIIVHGHTPVEAPEIHANRINIDTGAYATGRLTCLMLQDDAFAYI
jgi:serine/threonine protein phosphatase 1